MTAQKGLPFSLAAEKLILARILQDDSLHVQAAGLELSEVSCELHRRILTAYRDILERGEQPDIVTVSVLMAERGQDEGGTIISYLSELVSDQPYISNIEGSVRVVKDKAAMRAIALTGQSLMNRAMLEIDTPDEILSSAKNSLLALAEGRAQSSLETPGAIVEAAGGLSAYLDRRDRQEGVKTGFSLFDFLSGGLKPGKLYVIGARPRMGKTALVMNIAENVSVRGGAVTLIFSLEMDKESLLDRLICSRGRVNTKRFESGTMTAEESERITRVAGEVAGCDRIYIDDKATTDMQEIHAKVRKHAAIQPVGLVIIDYLQLMINGSEKYRVGEMSKIARDAKLLAKDCKVPVIGLSQLSRECDTRTDHRPQLSDLRESGAIEQDADLVAFLYRAEVYDPDRTDYSGLADLIIAKQRGGPEGVVPLLWMKEIVRFESRTGDHEEQQPWN